MVDMILLQIFILVSLAMIAAIICNLVKVPSVVGEILVGIAISNVAIGGVTLFSTMQLGDPNSAEVLSVLSELGIIFLLFTAGLMTPFHELKKVGVTAFLAACGGVLVSVFIVYFVMLGFGFTSMQSLFLGVALGSTSVGISARAMEQLNVLTTTEARVIISAAIIDDVIGLILLAIISGIAGGGDINIVDTAVVGILAVAFVLVSMFICSLIAKFRHTDVCKNAVAKPRKQRLLSPLPFALIICFGLSALATQLQLAAIIGAFLAGMMFAEFRDIWPSEEKFNSLKEFLVPFFFLFIGINVNLSSLTVGNAWMIAPVLIVLALAGKIIGCGVGALRLGKKSATIVGMGMTPRGEVTIIIAALGLSINVLTEAQYGSLVAVVIVVAVLAPFLISMAFKRKEKFGAKPMKFKEQG
jgi:Kef-type K+ transport system membrane component KefB